MVKLLKYKNSETGTLAEIQKISSRFNSIHCFYSPVFKLGIDSSARVACTNLTLNASFVCRELMAYFAFTFQISALI